MIDTGAACSLIHADLYKLIPIADLVHFPIKAREIRGPDGTPLNVLAKIRVRLTLYEAEAAKPCSDFVELYVIDKLEHDVLLGRPHIQKFISSIDCATGDVELNEDDEYEIPILLNMDVVIPPHARLFVPVIADLNYAPFSGSGDFYQTLYRQHETPMPLLVDAFSLTFTVGYESMLFHVPIYNPTNKPYMLNKGHELGRILAYKPGDHWYREQVSKNDPFNPLTPEDTDVFYINYAGINMDEYVLERDLEEQSHIDDIRINSDLTDSQRQELQQLLEIHKNVFLGSEATPKPANGISMRINTGDSSPIKQRPYKFHPLKRKRINDWIAEMKAAGHLVDSESSWCSPLRPVDKSDGRLRGCIDARKLNSVTIPDCYPLPRIDSILDSLRHAKYFSVIDLAAGYHQIPLHPEDQHKTAFITEDGLFEWTVMPEGIINGPAIFQRYMAEVLHGLIGKICWVYIDDILVFGNTWEEYIMNLQTVLERLSKYNLTAKSRKTKMGYTEVKILGHIVGNGQIKTNPEKISAIQHYPTPNSVPKIRSFMGLVNYFRKFIKNLAPIAEPIYRLLRKDVKFDWTVEQETAFQKLKLALMTAPVLYCPDFNKPFILETDASIVGLGAILSQTQDDNEVHPVQYLSRTLSSSEKNYAIPELECLAIVWAVKELDIYLREMPFIIYTDHQALSWLKTAELANRRLMRWRLTLSEYQYTIKYKKGKEMSHVDALSRNPSQSVIGINAIQISSENKINPKFTINNITSGVETFKGQLQFIINNIETLQTADKTYEVEKIINEKLEDGKLKYLVKWAGYSETDNTWEPEENLTNCQTALNEYRTQRSLEHAATEPLPGPEYNREPFTVRATEPITLPESDLAQYDTGFVDKLTQQIIKAQPNDDKLKPIINYLKNNELPAGNEELRAKIKAESGDYCIDNNNQGLYRQPRFRTSRDQLFRSMPTLVIPKEYQDLITRLYHDSVFAGHLGIQRTYASIVAKYYWNNMYNTIKDFVQHCVICQTLKTRYRITPTPVGTLPIPSYPFEIVAVDFAGPITPAIDGFKYLLVFMDYFTKWAIVVPTKNQDAETVAKALLDQVICKYGAPAQLLSDRGQAFLSKMMTELYIWLNIKKINTTAYHPQTNGMVERFNGTLITILRTICDIRKDRWIDYVAPAVWAYNTTPHSVIGLSPYWILFGREPRQPGPDITSILEDKYISGFSYINQLRDILSQSKLQVQTALAKQKVKLLGETKDQIKLNTFNVGDTVWFKAQLINDPEISSKLVSPWIGPFLVVKVISPVTYLIQRVKNLGDKPSGKPRLVHASKLKRVLIRYGKIEPALEDELINQPLTTELQQTEEQPAMEVEPLVQQPPMDIEPSISSANRNNNNAPSAPPSVVKPSSSSSDIQIPRRSTRSATRKTKHYANAISIVPQYFQNLNLYDN